MSGLPSALASPAAAACWFVPDRARYGRGALPAEAWLRRLAALNRLVAASCIQSAGHGWLGASYSVAEILTTLYFGCGERQIVLSKGHAAAMQYACLYGLGLLEREQLLAYQDGPAALQAHTDRRTPGILLDTGSLGQALSRVAGLALADRERSLFVVLGDGELQEGQCWEAFQTVVQHNLTGLTVIVDCNGQQTAGPVSAVKRIADLAAVGEGLGFSVREIDGSSPLELLACLSEPPARPRLLLARTRKAGGSPLLLELAAAGRAPGGWHSTVPDEATYLRLLEEQALASGDPDLVAELRQFLARRVAPPLRPPAAKAGSTGAAFARELARLMTERPDLVALDADLAQPCGIDGFARAGHPFLELGIAEQDMVGVAGGLALAGRLPVVHTYASFFKRAYDQLHGNGGLKVIYAGHYAGLCYHTDGKTHQSLADVSLFNTLPGMTVLDPATGWQAARLLRWAVRGAAGPTYFRLRRTDLGLDAHPLLQACCPTPEELRQEAGPAELDRPLLLGPPDASRVFLVGGAVAARLALDCLARPEFAGWAILLQSVYGPPPHLPSWREVLAPRELVFVLEDDTGPGGLHALLCTVLAATGLHPRVLWQHPAGLGPSFRNLPDCLEYHGFTPEHLRRRLREADGG